MSDVKGDGREHSRANLDEKEVVVDSLECAGIFRLKFKEIYTVQLFALFRESQYFLIKKMPENNVYFYDLP